MRRNKSGGHVSSSHCPDQLSCHPDQVDNQATSLPPDNQGYVMDRVDHCAPEIVQQRGQQRQPDNDQGHNKHQVIIVTGDALEVLCSLIRSTTKLAPTAWLPTWTDFRPFGIGMENWKSLCMACLTNLCDQGGASYPYACADEIPKGFRMASATCFLFAYVCF